MKSNKSKKRSELKTQREIGHANELNDGLRILARIIARAHVKKESYTNKRVEDR